MESKMFLREKEIQQNFKLPRGPWWGGLFERLILSTKDG